MVALEGCFEIKLVPSWSSSSNTWSAESGVSKLSSNRSYLFFDLAVKNCDMAAATGQSVQLVEGA